MIHREAYELFKKSLNNFFLSTDVKYYLKLTWQIELECQLRRSTFHESSASNSLTTRIKLHAEFGASGQHQESTSFGLLDYKKEF